MRPGLVVQAENDLVDLGNLPEQVELVAEKWSIEDRDDRLRCVKGQRAKARAFPPARRMAFMRRHRPVAWSRRLVDGDRAR